MATRRRLGCLILALVAATGCLVKNHSADSPTIEVSSQQLAPGGAYVAYVYGCAVGCDQIEKGDLVLAVGGSPVQQTADVDTARLATGSPVRLTVHRRRTGQVVDVEIVARPSDALPPVRDLPPFRAILAADLDRTPQWARRNLYGHVSPQTMLVHVDGGIVDGRQLVGKKRLLVFWDWATRTEQAQAINIMRVLQVAQRDLAVVGVEIAFAQLRFPTNSGRQAPMNDTNLRWFHERHGQPGHDMLPMYRFPNDLEYNRARSLGMEGSTTYNQYLRQPPAIVLLDERGVIRWHSEGFREPPPDDPVFADKEDQYTIIQAIEFAKTSL